MRTGGALALAAVVAATTATAAHGVAAEEWAWHSTGVLGKSSFGRPAKAIDLHVDAPTLQATMTAGHKVVLESSDGNVELEHNRAAARTTFVASRGLHGSPTYIGLADGQNVTAVKVTALAPIAADLQQWTRGTASAAIDGQGRLRLGPLTLVPQRSGSSTRLVAILPNGSRQVLVPVGTASTR